MNIKKILKITLLLIIFIIPEFAFCSNENKYIIAGALAEEAGDYQAAIIEYQKAISENPENPENIYIYSSLGGIYQYKLKDYSSAIKVYTQGLQLFPQDYDLNLNIMYAYFDLDDIHNGVNYYKIISKISNRNTSYSFPRASLQKIIKEMTQEEIINFCKKYLLINPKDNILIELLSKSYMDKCDYKNAKIEYEKMLDQGYHSSDIYWGLGVCYYYLGNYKDAKTKLKEAKDLGAPVPSQYFDMIEQKLKSSKNR